MRLATLCLPRHAGRLSMTLALPTYSSIGNIYAILDMGCVIPMSSGLDHRAASEQFVLRAEQGNGEDRDGEGKPWNQIDV